MHQILFHIPQFRFVGHQFPGIDIYTYGVMLGIAFLVALLLAVKRGQSAGISSDTITDLSVTLLIAGVVGSRLLFVAEDWSDYSGNLWSILNIREGGLSIHGGLIAGLLAGWWYGKRHKLDFWKTADVIAPSIAIGMGIGRIGCFFNGCCVGIPTRLPWGMVFKDSPIYFGPRHPTQLYEMLLDFVIAVILASAFKHSRPGTAFLWLWILVGVERFFIEFLRADAIPAGPLSLIQWLSIAVIVVASFLLLSRRKTAALAA